MRTLLLTVLTAFVLTSFVAMGCGPEPGDDCDEHYEQSCSADEHYVLECQQTDTGALHWFIDEDCTIFPNDKCVDDNNRPRCE